MKKRIPLPVSQISQDMATPHEKLIGRKFFMGLVPVTSLVNLPTTHNVRPDSLFAVGKGGSLCKAIQDKLNNEPQDFHTSHSGVTIVADDIEFVDGVPVLIGDNISLVDGGNTKAVVIEVLKNWSSDASTMPCVPFTIIITKDKRVRLNITIDRNSGRNPTPVTLMNALGYFRTLHTMFKNTFPDYDLLTREDLCSSEKSIMVARFIQLVQQWIPEELLMRKKTDTRASAVYRAQHSALQSFRTMMDTLEGNGNGNDPTSEKVRKCRIMHDNFYHGLSESLMRIFLRYKFHPALMEKVGKGKTLRQKPLDDGVLYPVIYAFAQRVHKNSSGVYVFSMPRGFKESAFILEDVLPLIESYRKKCKKHRKESSNKTKVSSTVRPIHMGLDENSYKKLKECFSTRVNALV